MIWQIFRVEEFENFLLRGRQTALNYLGGRSNFFRNESYLMKYLKRLCLKFQVAIRVFRSNGNFKSFREVFQNDIFKMTFSE